MDEVAAIEFLIDKLKTTKTNDEAGYFDLGPIDHGDHTRREICLALEALGFEIEASHHECAAGQHEIDFKYAEALNAADYVTATVDDDGIARALEHLGILDD